MRGASEGPFTVASDFIELVPRPYTSETTHGGNGEGADKMVIHKEIRYSIQYENEELSRQEDLKIRSVDVSAYV